MKKITLLLSLVITVAFTAVLNAQTAPFYKYSTYSGSNHLELKHLPLSTKTLSTNQLTIEAYIKTTQTGTGTIIGWSGSSDGVMMRINNGKLQWGEWVNETWLVATSTTTVNDGAWKHVAIVRDGAAIKMYINGAEDNVTLNEGTEMHANPTANTSKTIIGAMKSDGTESFVGDIDEVRVWNSARTTQEIADNRTKSIKTSETNLLGYYTFNDETGANTSTYPLDEFSVAGVNTTFDAAKLNKGVIIPGSGTAYVPCVNYRLPITDFTIEAWIKSTNNSGSRTIIGFKSTTPDVGIMLRTYNGKLQWGEWDGTDWKNILGNSTIPLDTWTHVAVVRTANGTESKLYVNGTLETAENNLTERAESLNTAMTTIGAIFPGGGEQFVGVIDEVRVWNSTRSITEITDNMNTELTSTTGLLGLYHLEADGKNEVSVTVAGDLPKNVGGVTFGYENSIFTNITNYTSDKLQIINSGGKIKVIGVEGFELYNIGGQKLDNNSTVKTGLYIVKVKGQNVKVLIK